MSIFLVAISDLVAHSCFAIPLNWARGPAIYIYSICTSVHLMKLLPYYFCYDFYDKIIFFV